ncbi:isochorismatase family protein [Amycolatopsis mongoliensis]|uniref:Isochorismatase family protein n=1 Tax=Amycolatopsis mongoliensis TaxID=715475 RepID=A0A9Y2JXZ8_9PSEU|nr:isochorismatase family protein [Amycolatopsis sp. 4-36]WIY05706.1 isochorismatase family protein [Amycolatopsis sp. 4-36]
MTEIDPATSALVLVDLQERIVALPTTPYSGEEVVANALRLRTAFREAGAPVVIVKVSRPDNPPGNELVFDAQDDKIVTKYTIGGFANTDLDEFLRAKGVRTVCFGGIATEFGVESSLRAASDHGYDTVVTTDEALAGLA